jgi:hypothetical protein
MPQQVPSADRRIHPGAPQRVIHRAPHDAGADRCAFSQPVQHEHLTRCRARPPVPQICRHRGPHLSGQRQQRAVTGLAGTDPHGSVAPVQVLQPQPHDLAGPHPQPGHAQDDRPVPQPARRGRIQRRDQLLQAPRLQMPDQAARTTRHHRDCVLQPVPAQPLRAQEPQERPQTRRGQRHRSRPRPRRVSPRCPPQCRRAPPPGTPARTARSYDAFPHTRRGHGADAYRRRRARPQPSADPESLSSAAPCLPN